MGSVDLIERIKTLRARQDKIGFNRNREIAIEKLKEKCAVLQITESAPANLDVENKNETEKVFAIFAQKQGWSFTKRGWPDFLCWEGDRLIFVEVKKEGQKLRPHQKLTMQKLSSAGLECYQWSPLKGFRKITPIKPLALAKSQTP